ncbi:kinase-like domain-containing protein [Sphaerosporella brunnea]|uniref:EKC/KEOPS complex subunit BUD32 n=1 Tax=Sphaerosporella brunnea TaxID=1250544 RepID=A0A5J5EJD1_9PEZI|nr:kinase-like domain-containing protein [Sphaerosporella brunnea]
MRSVTGKMWPNEAAMYSPVVALLRALLPGYLVTDTHLNHYLSDRAPDITVSLEGIKQIHKQYIVTLLLIKRITANLDGAVMGQALDQLYKLAECQPWRQSITILVSSIKLNVFLTLERVDSSLEMIVYDSVNFETAMKYLKEVVNDPKSQPRSPPFSTSLGAIDEILGNTKLSAVAQFTVKGVPPGMQTVDGAPTLAKRTAIAVKHCTAGPASRMIKNELQILRAMQQQGGHHLMPRLLFHSPDELEYGMLPVGKPVDMVLLNNNGLMARQVTADVFSAMTWLHEHNIVHRDIRWGNIILHNGHGVLIDFGSAVVLPTPPIPYEGGFLCCPPRILPSITQPYTPAKADDYHAFVLLFNALLHPRSMKSFLSRMVNSPNSLESKCLQHLWLELTDSDTWGRYVEAAAQEDLEVLKNMPTALVVLDQSADAAWLHPDKPDLDTAFRHLTLEPESAADDGESGSTQLGAATLNDEGAQHGNATIDGQGGPGSEDAEEVEGAQGAQVENESEPDNQGDGGNQW